MSGNSSTEMGSPDPALIDSMAMRYRHDFGLLPENERESIRTTMRQLWEEATGRGFYRLSPEPSGWQPIEKAPKGVYILIELAGCSIPGVGWIDNYGHAWIHGESYSTPRRWHPLPAREAS